MKKVVFVILIIIELCMFLLTLLIYNSEKSELLFQGGSIGSTMKMFAPNFWVVFLLFVFTVLSTIFFRKKMKTLLVSFLILFSMWVVSGRTIGVQWTGELTTGWFYISSDEIIILSKSIDCTGEVIECTTAKNSSVFQLKFINGNNEKNVFVGPLIRSDLRNYFNQNGNNTN